MASSPAVLPPSVTLVFIRHGETDWNVEHRFQGQQDVPLNQRGREQAARNGRALRAIDGIERFDFAASPLQRAAETMRIVRTELRLDPEAFRIEPQLIEITFGDWEGSTLAELAVGNPVDVERRQADKWGFVPPGGESYEMLERRVRKWLASLTGNIVAVSHGAVARIVQGLLFRVPDMDIPSLPSPQDQVLLWRSGAARWL